MDVNAYSAIDFSSAFVSGMHQYCQTVFECTVNEFMRKRCEYSFLDKVEAEIANMKEVIIGRFPHQVQFEDCTCGCIEHDKEQFPTTVVVCKFAGVDPEHNIPTYDGSMLYDRILKAYPRQHLQKILKLCTLVTLLQRTNYNSRGMRELYFILVNLWPKYIMGQLFSPIFI